MAMETAAIGGRRFDPSMSRRTRKQPAAAGITNSSPDPPADRAAPRRVSLQDLITVDDAGGGGEEAEEGEAGDGTVLCKLVDTMEEDLERNKLAIVVKQQQDGGEPAGTVRRYVRLLADLMKARRRSSKKKKKELTMRSGVLK